MTGGLTQLLFVGSQDILLKFNPEITYFKKVYRTHSNFSMESIRVELNRSDANIYNNTTYKLKIPRHADLIAQIYLVVTLPDIVSDNILGFRWVENIGEALINNYYITIGGNKIDMQTGDFIHAVNQLSLNKDKRDLYDNLTGNVMQLNNPDQYMLTHNNLSKPPIRYRIGQSYPTVAQPINIKYGDEDNFTPSIPSRTIYVPLYFWFNREIGNALPLISLQYSEVEVTIELNPLNTLYKVFYNIDNVQDYYAPSTFITAHQLHNFVTNVRMNSLVSNTVVDIKAAAEINFIYLDTIERNYFAYKPLEYLIEQVTRIEHNNLAANNIISLILQNPVKELIWYCRRDNVNVKNDWFDFTDVDGGNIMKTAKIMFNGFDRFDSKPVEYFNWLQPFQHHSANSKPGLMCYSFAIDPENYQPSGSVNMSRINNIQFNMTVKQPRLLLNENVSNYNYDAVFFAINYNFLTIASGLGGVKFSS